MLFNIRMSKKFDKADNSESLCEEGLPSCSKDGHKLSQCSDTKNWATDSDTQNDYQNEDHINTVYKYNCQNSFLVLPLSNKKHLITNKFENLYEAVTENLGGKDELQSTTCNENNHKILPECSGSDFCDNSGNKNSVPRRILESGSMLQLDNLLLEKRCVFSENRNTHQVPNVLNFNYVDISHLENINVVCNVHITKSFFPLRNKENTVFSENIFMEKIIPTSSLRRSICVNPLSTIVHNSENSRHKKIDCPVSIQANNKKSLTQLENNEYQENSQFDGFDNSIKDLLTERAEMEPLSCEMDIKESLLHEENLLDTNLNIDVPIPSLVHASQKCSSEEKKNNCFILGSDGQVHEVIQENIWIFVDQFNSEPDTMSNSTYDPTPLQSIQPILHFSGSPQQPANKESIFFECQPETEKDLQMENSLGREGHSLQINSNILPLTLSEDDDVPPFDGNMKVSESKNSEISNLQEEVKSRSNCIGKSFDIKEVQYQDSEDAFPANLKTISTHLNSSQKLSTISQRKLKEEHLPKKMQQESMEFVSDKTRFEDACIKNEIPSSSDQKSQRKESQTSMLLEKMFPHNSIQYSTRILKDIHANILDLQKIVIGSETNVKDSIIKYVDNKNLETQLLEIVEKYSQNRMEVEQRLLSIAQHLIEEQIQIIKSFKESSQAHIAMLVNQKNAVEQENIMLLKKLDKLYLKIKDYVDVPGAPSDGNITLLQNNEKLRNKLTVAHHTVFQLQTVNQETLNSLELCADEMNKQRLIIQAQKMKQSRDQNDVNAEKAYLWSELEKAKKSLQEVTDVASIIIDDIRNLKTSLDETGRKISLNWEKIEMETGAPLMKVMMMICTLIHDLGTELLCLSEDYTTKEKELFSVKNSNKELENVLNELDTEYDILRKQSDQVINEKINTDKQLIKITQDNCDLKEKLLKCSNDITVLEMELVNLQEVKKAVKEQEDLKTHIEKSIEELKEEKQNLIQKLLSDEKKGRAMEVDLMKMTAHLQMYQTKNKELTIANLELEKQLENLQKSFVNLQNLPQQYQQLEKNYFKEVAEKDFLSQQFGSLKGQLAEFSDSKTTHNKHLQNLESEYTKITKENLEMKWELKNLKNINQCLEHDNCNMLHRIEEEAAKHKHQMNESESKTFELEARIKGHEKEIQELKDVVLIHTNTIRSLQKEYDEKKDIISNLEEKCQDLNMIQQRYENQIFILNNKIQELENHITEINNGNTVTLNSIKYEFEALETTLKITQDDLNNTIIKLQEKEATLLSFQEDLQTAECRLVEKEHQLAENTKTIEVLQKDLQDASQIRNHYIEIQKLLKDHESIVQERDKLNEDYNNLLHETETLQQNMKEMHSKNDTLVKYCSLQKEHIKGMKAQINKLQDYLTKVNVGQKENVESELHQVASDLALHNNKSADLEYEIEEYKFILDEKQNGNEEKSRLQSQVMLLHELHERNSNILKQAKRTIKMQEDKITELKIQLNEEVNKHNDTENEYASILGQQKAFMSEVETLQLRVQQETQNCKSLTEEYYNYEKEMSAKEANFIATINELKTQNENLTTEMKNIDKEKEELMQDLENNKKGALVLKEKNEEMESRLSDYGRTLSLLAQEKRKNEQLENQLHIVESEGHNLMKLQQLLQKQHSDVTIALEDSRQELKRTREALGALEQLEKQHAQELQDIKREHSNETSQLFQDMKLMEMKKTEAEQIIKDLMRKEKFLHTHKKDLSFKLLKALKLIYQTKLKFTIANEKVQELSSQIKTLREQKIQKEDEVTALSSEISVLNEKVKQKNNENEIQSTQDQLQQCVSNLQIQVEDLQGQLLKAKHKIQNDCHKAEALLLIKEDNILQSKEQIHLLKEKTNRLHSELVEAQNKLLQQNQDQSKLKRDIVSLQAEKRNLSLQLQVTEGYLSEEKQQRTLLEDSYKKILGKHSSEEKS